MEGSGALRSVGSWIGWDQPRSEVCPRKAGAAVRAGRVDHDRG